MYKLIQKNQKKFLAVFGVLLMIVFILPQSFKNNMSRGDLAIGTVDGEKITGNELGQAKNDLDFLREKEFLPLFEMGAGPDFRSSSNVYAKYFHGEDGARAYLLLQKEAEKQGFVVSTQAADALARSAFNGMPQEQLDAAIPVVGRFMLVQAAFDRASQSVKPSRPLVQYYVAENYQASKLNLVEFNAADLEKTIPDPTPGQISQQYDKYGDQFPAQSFMTTQPAEPGYKVAQQVKLQYLELPRAAVVESVLKELSRDELYVLDRDAGYAYYQAHQSDFTVPTPATLPSTAPAASQPATLPTTTPAGPTTKPFPEVRVDIEKRLLTDANASSNDTVVSLRARVTAREKQLRTALHDELAHAYVEWAAAQAASTTQPAVPTTNPLVAIYPELDYLTAFANAFEAQYKVRPLVNSLANAWLGEKDLYTLSDLSSAKAGETPFAEYAMHDLTAPPTTQPAAGPAGPPTPADLVKTQPSTTNPATAPAAALAALNPTTIPAEPAPQSFTSWHPVGTGLRPFEPSSLLESPAGNAFVFRLTAFDPAHKPPLADVLPEIIKNLKLTAAYQLAQDQAAKLLSNAQIEAKLRKNQNLPDLQGLPAAARASGDKLIEAGPVRARSLSAMSPIPGFEPANYFDKFIFTKAVQDLAAAQTPTNLHPSSLIELPAEGKVLVAEMGDTILPMPANEMYVADQTIAPLARNALENGQFTEQNAAPGNTMLHDWFDLNNIEARVKYVKAKGS